MPRRETAAKGRCSLPFTSCLGPQRQDQTPSQPLALSPASSRAPRAEGLTVTGSAQHRTLSTFPASLGDPGTAQKLKEIKRRHVDAAAFFSPLAPVREPPSHFSSRVGPEPSGAITACGAAALLLGALGAVGAPPPHHQPPGICNICSGGSRVSLQGRVTLAVVLALCCLCLKRGTPETAALVASHDTSVWRGLLWRHKHL